MSNASSCDAMGKTELRAACKAAGISYGKLTVAGMRDALNGKHKRGNGDEVAGA